MKNKVFFEMVEINIGREFIPALFANCRFKSTSIPDGYYKYDVRHDDEWLGIEVEIKEFIMVNHWGTILTLKKLTSNKDESIMLEEGAFNYLGEGIELEIEE